MDVGDLGGFGLRHGSRLVPAELADAKARQCREARDPRVRISAKADYAVRATVELASLAADGPVKGDRLAAAQDIPLNFLENIMRELRKAGILGSQRGAEGGYWLARPAEDVTIADVIRAVEGPIADVRGTRPERLSYQGSAAALARRLGGGAGEPPGRPRARHDRRRGEG